MPADFQSRYRARIAAGALTPDDAQARAAEAFAALEARLAAAPKAAPAPRSGFFRRAPQPAAGPAPKGLYLWGGVGRGKSMLMDLFYEDAPIAPRRRVHFHAFMQEVHAAINAERKRGTGDPIGPVGDEIADGAALLCFDEMQVSDIADAMILGRLFERLFARKVVVVATSNRPPDDLYKDGLNRGLFLPFIAMLKDKMSVHELDSDTDHRLIGARRGDLWFSPLGQEARAQIDGVWRSLTGAAPTQPARLDVYGRTIAIPAASGAVARARFADLCEAPLGPADFLAIAARFDTVILEDVPRLSKAQANAAKRFVTLIDALYEARRRLVVSAEAEPEALYVDGDGAFEFARAASRLAEMRSVGYLDAFETRQESDVQSQ